MALNDTISTALNNPECAILVGKVWGEMTLTKYIVIIFVSLIIYRSLDKLAITPLLDWLIKKFGGRK